MDEEPAIKTFAVENNAKIKIKETSNEGYFILQASKFCFTDVGKIDRRILRFMRNRCVFIDTNNGIIQIEIICFFTRRVQNLRDSRVNILYYPYFLLLI